MRFILDLEYYLTWRMEGLVLRHALRSLRFLRYRNHRSGALHVRHFRHRQADRPLADRRHRHLRLDRPDHD
ncbi:hypothetical protein CNECB9_2550005 [Cupriavidus necator]|uniref:Uncharacterized protein n=1 Tax=Cupriavidus necator TaxID=106590 RepID=A0A1K0IEV6_CUPNE|nr:hypothetical protein CNECB9_2550005 [Cupriavidus necator]